MHTLQLVGEVFHDSCRIVNAHFLLIIPTLEEGNVNLTKLIRTVK